MPHRYFTQDILEQEAFLRGAEAHHLGKVMRGKCGQELILCDGQGTDYLAEVVEIQKEEVRLKILSSSKNLSEPSHQVNLYVGYPKQDKLEWIIQKAVELGAVRIVPFFSKFCVVQPKKEQDKNQRYQRIALEAAKQSGRGVIPIVEMPLTYTELLAELKQFDVALFCYECGGKPIKDAIQTANKVAIVTGSEGGFSPQEAEQAEQAGATLIGLGKRILRCETAPLAALTAAMTLWGEFE